MVSSLGAVLVAGAPGVISWAAFELDGGGLKVAVEHGGGCLPREDYTGAWIPRAGPRP